MNKRPNIPDTHNTRSKRSRNEKIIVVKKIVIRSDDDPHVFININCAYVKLGNYVYKVKMFDNHQENDIGDDINDSISLTLAQYTDVKDYVLKNKITVASFDSKEIPMVENLTITLSTRSDF